MKSATVNDLNILKRKEMPFCPRPDHMSWPLVSPAKLRGQLHGQMWGRLKDFLAEGEQDVGTMVAYNLILLFSVATPAFAIHPFHDWFNGKFT